MTVEQLAALRTEADTLVAACRLAGPDAPVPSCPGWDIAALAGHVGFVHRWAARIVTTGNRPGKGELGERPDRTGAIDYLAAGIAPLIDALGAADPTAPCWNFSPAPQVAGFWLRRQVQETAVHRWDAQTATGTQTPIAAAVAADGLAEVFDVQIPQVLAVPDRPRVDLGGSLHLHCTDTEGEWTFRIDGGALSVTVGHSKGDVALRGPASQLLLSMWRRVPVSADGLEVFGDRAVLDRLLAMPWI
ncbi:MAG: maleylpyruvate isomerase family mycothiol-dependent enzyme [Acidimicrobiales bacterium]